MSNRLRALLILGILFSGAAVVWVAADRSDHHAGSGPEPSLPPGPRPTAAPPKTEILVGDRLQQAGWTASAAGAVAGFHARWLTALRDLDPPGFERTVVRLEQLPPRPEIFDVLARRPELAGLLVAADDPEALARDLDDPADGEVVASLFQFHADPAEARLLAAALPEHRALIADLVRRGFVGAEHLFMFPRGSLAADAYARWVGDTLRAGLSRNNDALAAAVWLLFEHGPRIRERMADDGFRMRFPGLWRKLAAAVARHSDDVAAYLDLPGLWDFLDRPDAERLLERKGALAIDLLFGPTGYPKSRRESVARLLADQDEEVAEALWLARREPAILPFVALEPPLPPDVWTALAHDVLGHHNEIRPRLELHQRRLDESRDKLAEALGTRPPGLKEYVPFYSVYKVFDALADGDDPETLDLVFAAVDVADVAVPGGKLVTTLGKSAARKLGTAAAKELLAEAGRKVLTGRVKDLARSVVANRALARLVAVRAYREHIVQVGRALTEVDVTGLVQYAFRTFGLSRQTVRRLTGLEARVFMRPDATVSLRLTRPKLPKAGDLLKDALVEMATDQFLPGGSRDWRPAAGVLWLASAAGLLPDEPGQ